MSLSVSSAVVACNQANTEESSMRAYEAMLWAIGNSHAGTYNSSALLLVDLFPSILSAGNSWSQRAALEVLIDLYASFEPEAGSESQRAQLAADLRQRIEALEIVVLAIAQSSGAASSSAGELLELLRDPAV